VIPTNRNPLAGSIAAVSLALLGGCNRMTPVKAAVDEPALVRVSAVRVEKRDLARGAELAAEFRPYQEVDVHAKVAGYLKNITVDVGDRVAQGRVIGTLEVPEYAQEMAHASALEKRSELDVAKSRAEVLRAQSAFDLRKVSYERLMAASKARPKLIAQQELDNAAALYREAEAQLATARATVASVEQQVQVNAASSARVRTMMSYLQIVAPFSGVVTRRYADTGAMIQAGTASQTQAMPVVRIAQIDRLRLVLPVPESIVSRVHIGSPVEVRVDSLQRVFQGRVSRFTGQLNSSTRTMNAEVDVDNRTGVILPGMYGYASLTLDRRSSTLSVPVQAIAHGSRTSVLVIDQTGRTEEREVRMGLETPNAVEILSGLREGELVMIGNRSGIKTGTRVEPRIARASEFEGGE
jgi:RND family efflux transporter MFP subunit